MIFYGQHALVESRHRLLPLKMSEREGAPSSWLLAVVDSCIECLACKQQGYRCAGMQFILGVCVHLNVHIQL